MKYATMEFQMKKPTHAVALLDTKLNCSFHIQMDLAVK